MIDREDWKRFLYAPMKNDTGNGLQGNARSQAELGMYIDELKKVNEELRQARRAALNLMEDAIQSKEAVRLSEEKYRTRLEKEVEERTAEVKHTKELLQATLDSSLYIIQAFQAVRNKEGKIVDFTWVMNNRQAIEQNGEMTGKSLLQQKPDIFEQGLFQKFVEVTETGISADFEHLSSKGRQPAWYHQTLVKMGDGFVMSTEDITDKRKSHEEILKLKDTIAKKASDKYYSLFNSIDEGFCLLELLNDEEGKVTDFRYIEVNNSFERQTGLTHVIGKTGKEVLPHYEPSWLEVYEQVVVSGKTFRFENYNETTQRWYESYVSHFKGAESRQVAIVFNDITVRKKAENALKESDERKTFLLKLSDAIHHLSDAVEVEETVTTVAMNYFKADRCYYCEIDGEKAIIRRDASKEGLSSVAGTYDLNSMPIFKTVLDAGKPFIIQDVRTSNQVDEIMRGLCLELKIISVINIPIIKNNIPQGILSLVQSNPRVWTNFELDLAGEVAERTWAAVERARANKALRNSEDRFRTLANAVPQVIWTNNAEGKANYFNQRWYEYSGLNYEQSVVEGWQVIVHPDDGPSSIEKWNRALAEGEIFDTEYRLRGHDGNYRWFIGRNVPLKNAQGKVVGWFGSATDIEDFKKAQEALSQSEVRLRITMESARDYAIITMNKERMVEKWSSGAEQIFGYTEEEMIGRSADIIFTAEDMAAGAPEAEMVTARDTGRAADERWHVRKDGRLIFADGMLRPIKDKELSGYVKVIRDVTEQKKAEETLRLMEERYRIALESAEMGAWDLNVAKDEIIWNNKHFELLGLPPSSHKINSDFFLEFVYEKDRKLVENALQKALNENGIFHAEFRIRREGSDELRWMTGYGKVVGKKGGKGDRMIGVMYDSTQLKLSTEELHRLVNERTIELQRSNEDLRQFAHVASHDLKEPIRKIQTFNNRILDEYADAMPKQARVYCEKIEMAADRMISMIEGVLSYSKLINGEHALQNVDLEEVIRQITSDLEVPIQQKDAKINASALPTIEGNHTLIYQLFYNLILNSLKFSREGVPPRIDISFDNVEEQDNKFIRINVSDNGIGFEPEFEEDIFKAFTRLHSVKEYEGTGLGLALCKKIVERHGGSLKATGKPDEGASFSIMLPVNHY